jgi:hypothetical protein
MHLQLLRVSQGRVQATYGLASSGIWQNSFVCLMQVIFTELMKHISEPFPGAGKVLVLAHRQELLSQARLQILRFHPHLVSAA